MHGQSVEVRLRDYKRSLKKGIKKIWYHGCKFDFTIDCIFGGRHKYSLEEIMQEVIKKHPKAGDPLIEASLKILMNKNMKRYRIIKINNKPVNYNVEYCCLGHSPKYGNNRMTGMLKQCPGCRFYRD